MENIIYFNKDLKKVDEKVKSRLGIRGRKAVELASMGFPIAPGFIIDCELTKKLPQVNLKEILKTYIGKIDKDTKKKFGDPNKPLMLKIVLSSDLNVPFFPSIHNVGMNQGQGIDIPPSLNRTLAQTPCGVVIISVAFS